MGDVAVAIVGIGAVFPGAPDVSSFWHNIVNGVDAVTDVPAGRWGVVSDFYCRRGGFLDELASFDPIAFGVMPSTVDVAEPDQLLALSVAAAAIADAGGESVLHDRTRVGIVVGRGGYLTPGCARLDQRVQLADQVVSVLRDLLPGMDLDTVRDAVRDKLGPMRPEASIGLVPNLAASRIANRFDLRGSAYTVDAACASGLVAVEHAVRELVSGRADAMLAGAVHLCHHPTLWSVFTQLRALSPSERIRPFDRSADGTLLSEGVGMVLLKRLSDVRDERVYAVIRGVGTASDGRATSMMTPNPDGQLLAVRRAWQEAGLDPLVDSPALIEAHGTATPAGDAAELSTMLNAFGASGSPIGIGTVKSQIGHAMPAAGMAGLIKAALALHHGILPPTLHIDEPHSTMSNTRLEPVLCAREWEGVPRAVVNAFGFGGINAHVVLEAPARGFAPTQPSVVTFAADSPAELASCVRSGRQSRTDRAFRLAIGNPTPRKLALAVKVVEQGRPWPGRHDIWFTPSPLITGPDQVAFLFPGFERAFSGEVENQGVELLESGRRLAAELAELGITPGAVAGHSMGEWTAMVVAGIYPTIDSFVSALRPGMVAVADVEYAALGCSAATAESVVDGDVVVSHDNCPHQSVICGPSDQLAVALERLRERGVLAQLMPFRTGFHTPALAKHLAEARAMLDALPVSAPRIPVWSATSLAPMPADPDEIRSLVLRHLVEPVRFRELTARLHEQGFRAFVQVGEGSLPGFVADTLNGRNHLAVSGSPQAVAAAMWAFGLKRASSGVRLELGVPSVRLDPIAMPSVAVSSSLKSVDALFAHTNAVAREIASAMAPQEMSFTREFSLGTMPELVDHSVFPQAPGWPDLADGFPIVPATGLLEVFADAARRLVDGTVHGFASVRAKRWLSVLPGVQVKITARVVPDGVHVSVGDYAEGVVLMSPVSGRFEEVPLRRVRPAPVNARELYRDNWMFHGPAFAGVTSIESLADNGITGTLTPLPAPGALLDSAGQLIGHWMQVSHTVDQTVLPVGISSVSFEGPTPAGPVACTAWIRSVTPSEMVADAVLRADGAVWCRITGWTTRRFTTDHRIWQVKLRPGTEALSERADGWAKVRENWVDSATRDLIMRRYLNSAERQEYAGLDVPAQRRWLLRAIAMKDAVRFSLWDKGAGPIYPAELTVRDDRVSGAFAVPWVSVLDEAGSASARVEG
ncbi:polyketide synthase [Lentzea sp. NBRC 105346]|uniref:beta-ketoacyl synthase N-terminal-like domain-containing protein n=1 Tax=Lentzea sp. NBRC 105346 TaxID=3032205 RepID=UPI0024A2FE7D|nr:beta-ketoacyl synthase N-terminal-like domain-containing protein [Lentzea sp. NBRC 105346]GLZ28416.1 polyketide synthase [Lentzea sp. NBRC 105346]